MSTWSENIVRAPILLLALWISSTASSASFPLKMKTGINLAPTHQEAFNRLDNLDKERELIKEMLASIPEQILDNIPLDIIVHIGFRLDSSFSEKAEQFFRLSLLLHQLQSDLSLREPAFTKARKLLPNHYASMGFQETMTIKVPWSDFPDVYAGSNNRSRPEKTTVRLQFPAEYKPFDMIDFCLKTAIEAETIGFQLGEVPAHETPDYLLTQAMRLQRRGNLLKKSGNSYLAKKVFIMALAKLKQADSVISEHLPTDEQFEGALAQGRKLIHQTLSHLSTDEIVALIENSTDQHMLSAPSEYDPHLNRAFEAIWKKKAEKLKIEEGYGHEQLEAAKIEWLEEQRAPYQENEASRAKRRQDACTYFIGKSEARACRRLHEKGLLEHSATAEEIESYTGAMAIKEHYQTSYDVLAIRDFADESHPHGSYDAYLDHLKHQGEQVVGMEAPLQKKIEAGAEQYRKEKPFIGSLKSHFQSRIYNTTSEVKKDLEEIEIKEIAQGLSEAYKRHLAKERAKQIRPIYKKQRVDP